MWSVPSYLHSSFWFVDFSHAARHPKTYLPIEMWTPRSTFLLNFLCTHRCMPMLGRWHLSIVSNRKPWRPRAFGRIWLMLTEDFSHHQCMPFRSNIIKQPLRLTIAWNWKHDTGWQHFINCENAKTKHLTSMGKMWKFLHVVFAFYPSPFSPIRVLPRPGKSWVHWRF